MSARQFPLGDVLSVTTGILLCDVGNVYGLLNFLTADNIYTHQLPRVSRECAPHILRQHPQLSAINATGVDESNWRTWLDDQIAEFGDAVSLTPLPEHEHEVIDPVSELAEIVHPDKILIVNTGESA